VSIPAKILYSWLTFFPNSLPLPPSQGCQGEERGEEEEEEEEDQPDHAGL
jgi:hypothetical protein